MMTDAEIKIAFIELSRKLPDIFQLMKEADDSKSSTDEGLWCSWKEDVEWILEKYSESASPSKEMIHASEKLLEMKEDLINLFGINVERYL